VSKIHSLQPENVLLIGLGPMFFFNYNAYVRTERDIVR